MNTFQRKMGSWLEQTLLDLKKARAECGNMAERDRMEAPQAAMETRAGVRSIMSFFLTFPFKFSQIICTGLFSHSLIYLSNQYIFWACIICQMVLDMLENKIICSLVARVYASDEEYRWTARQFQDFVIGAREERSMLWKCREDTKTHASPRESGRLLVGVDTWAKTWGNNGNSPI